MTGGKPQPYQATSVAIDGRAVLIEGKPGGGKSTLAMMLIDRGAVLVGDDGVVLSSSNAGLFAQPHPEITGKLEVRGVGLGDLPTTSARVSLVVDLDQEGERMPDQAATRSILGVDLPCIALGGSDPASLPLRVEWALRIHGTHEE